MTLEVLAANFVDALDFSTLIAWADMLNVEHDEDEWLDDQWPDRETSLRVAVVEALLKVGSK